jgi:ferric-dicitrate binding protein FerR (iron transport regulator)
LPKPKFVACFLTAMLWLWGTLVCAFAQTDLPAGIVAAEQFEPGLGLPTGKVQWARGKAFIIHQGGEKAFAAKPGLPLYQADTLLTGADGSTACALNDGSQFALAPDARLVVKYSVYNAVQKQRQVDLFLKVGRARFRVKKLDTATIQDFRVRTDTAAVLALVSEFIVRATTTSTEITALENCRLEVNGLADVEKKLQLTDNQRTIVDKDSTPWAVMAVPAEEIRQLQQELSFFPGQDQGLTQK